MMITENLFIEKLWKGGFNYCLLCLHYQGGTGFGNDRRPNLYLMAYSSVREIYWSLEYLLQCQKFMSISIKHSYGQRTIFIVVSSNLFLNTDAEVIAKSIEYYCRIIKFCNLP
jgi:hypothetical protein